MTEFIVIIRENADPIGYPAMHRRVVGRGGRWRPPSVVRTIGPEHPPVRRHRGPRGRQQPLDTRGWG
jgi:hypothetical protein